MFGLLAALGCAGSTEPGGDVSTRTLIEGRACATGAPGPQHYEPGDLGEDWAAQQIGTLETPGGWGAAVEDFDGDGRLDVFLPQPARDELYLQLEPGEWSEVSATALPVESEPGIGAAAADVDGDGDVDLAVFAGGEGGYLAINEGGWFRTLGEGTGIERWMFQAFSGSWADMDGDGDLDLVIARMAGMFLYDGYPPTPSNNVLLRNDGDLRFTDVSDRLVGNSQAEFTFSATWLDGDGDGDQDLFFNTDKGHTGWSNAYLRNDGSGRFEEATTEVGLDPPMLGAMGVGIGDLNDDRLPDLLVADWGRLWLFESHGSRWVDTAESRHAVNDEEADQVVAWAPELEDLDADGDLDVTVAYSPDDMAMEGDPGRGVVTAPDAQPDSLLLQEDGLFREVAGSWGAASLGVTRGGVVVDLDGDGALDQLRRDLLGPTSVLVHQGGSGNWISIRLEQGGPNPRGIGARIEVDAGGQTHTRWIRAGGVSLSSSGPPVAHFGLGTADVAEEVRVYWPDGDEQVRADVPACTQLVVSHSEL